MISDIGPLAQAAIGTLFTWFLTAAGAAVVVIFSGSQKPIDSDIKHFPLLYIIIVIYGCVPVKMKLLHASLGFAAGVMLAASFWSLLSPAIELAEQSKHYGDNGEYAFLPVSVGFLFGGLFVYLTDVLISSFGLCAPQLLLVMQKDAKNQIKRNQMQQKQETPVQTGLTIEDVPGMGIRRKTGDLETQRMDLARPYEPVRSYTMISSSDPTSLNCYESNAVNSIYPTTSTSENPRPRFLPKGYPKRDHKRRSTISNPPSMLELQKVNQTMGDNLDQESDSLEVLTKDGRSLDQWKRIILLIVAITVHNIPEGLAVGVGFGAIGSAPSATFENARNLAIGIGIQNFPEGLAVSLPLKAVGFSLWKSFWYGQLSGMVEPIFGILGAAAVSLAKPLLPYALSFAAGAMIYVVVDDIIPEANSDGREKLATSATIIGFVVMMALDVGLGG